MKDTGLEELLAKVAKFAEERTNQSAYFDIFDEAPGQVVYFDKIDLFVSMFKDKVLPELEDIDDNDEPKDVLEKYLSDLVEKLEAVDIKKESNYHRWGILAGIIIS